MMKNYRYLIVGGGMTADAAVRGIRERDKDGTIAVLSGEKHPPYDRPPLSKKLCTGQPLDSICRSCEPLTALIDAAFSRLTHHRRADLIKY